MVLPAVLLLTCALLIVFSLWKSRLPRNSPPGPRPLPIVGNVWDLKTAPMHLTFKQWTQQYTSNTISCHVGNRTMVIMHDIDTVRKVFGREDTAGRDQTAFFPVANKGHGLVFSQGDLWKTQRRFALSALRDFGMGKSWLDQTIMDEVDDMCKLLTELNGEPTDLRHILSHSVSNVISALIFGKRFPHTDVKFKRLTTRISEAFELGDNTIYVMFPFLKYTPGFKDDYEVMQRFFAEIRGFVKDLIDEHGQSFRPDDVKDYVDAFIKETSESKSDDPSNSFDEEQLIWSVFDLFSAGTDTTSTTAMWAIVFILENPDILERVQKEMDDNLPADQPLQISHRGSVPFTEATIMEVERLASLVPLAVSHVNNYADVEIDGYTVPKGSLLFANTHSIHRDLRYWKNPDVFNPTRFLDSAGKVFKPDAFVPFSVGKRACLGEALAKAEMFLFIGNLFRRFNYTLPQGNTVSHKDVNGIFVLSPKPFEVIVTPRKYAV